MLSKYLRCNTDIVANSYPPRESNRCEGVIEILSVSSELWAFFCVLGGGDYRYILLIIYICKYSRGF